MWPGVTTVQDAVCISEVGSAVTVVVMRTLRRVWSVRKRVMSEVRTCGAACDWVLRSRMSPAGSRTTSVTAYDGAATVARSNATAAVRQVRRGHGPILCGLSRSQERNGSAVTGP